MKNAKVYVIEHIIRYDGYTILKIFTTKHKALKFISKNYPGLSKDKEHARRFWLNSNECITVVEYTLE